MTMLKARRGTMTRALQLRGRVIEPGETFDSADFPALNAAKWLQLQEQGLVELVDLPGRGALTRAAAEQGRASAHLSDDFTRSLIAVDQPCPICDFVAKNEHGLKIHTGRRHNKKE